VRLDGTVLRVRLDRRVTAIVLLVMLGVREDGQKVLLAVKNMGGETSEGWRTVLDDLVHLSPAPARVAGLVWVEICFDAGRSPCQLR
jgi:hypothetical protein